MRTGLTVLYLAAGLALLVRGVVCALRPERRYLGGLNRVQYSVVLVVMGLFLAVSAAVEFAI
jgi:hypothetical protein